MKSTIATLALALTFSTTAFSADGLVLTIKGTEVLTLKKISKTKFEKISQVATGNATLDHYSAKGKRNLMFQEFNEADTKNYVAFEVTGKNILKIIDIKENINKEVSATINSGLLGGIKKIKVDAKTIEGLYAESMKKSGLDVLKGLKVLGAGGSLTSSIVNSDMNCEADEDLLVCKQDSTLLLAIE